MSYPLALHKAEEPIMHEPQLFSVAILSAALAATGAGAAAQDTQTLGHAVYGDGAAKVIVLHDWLGSSITWEPVTPYLDTDRFTFVFVDVRGYGASIDMTGEYTTEEIAGDIFALADALEFADFHLIGHSMTGMAGFNAISTGDGERIQSYVAVAPTPPSGFPADQETREFFAAIPHAPEVTRSAFDGLTGGRYESTEWARLKTERNIDTSSQAAMRGYGAMIYEDLSQRLLDAAPETPVLVIAGPHDLPPMRPEALEAGIVPLVPNARVVSIDGAGHYPMNETPPRLAQLIQEHLAAHAD